jgi:hypothetical protein
MWMPIMIFFGMTFEHSVVNMFLFPSGLIMGGRFSILDYFIWNEIPTVLGNLVGGLAFTGLTLYSTHIKTAPKLSRQYPDFSRQYSDKSRREANQELRPVPSPRTGETVMSRVGGQSAQRG